MCLPSYYESSPFQIFRRVRARTVLHNDVQIVE
jgi:hypothetical protein